MTHQDMRRVRVHAIMQKVNENYRLLVPIKKTLLIGQICIEFGAGERYVKELVKNLVDVGKIIDNDGFLWKKELWEAEQIEKKWTLNGSKV